MRKSRGSSLVEAIVALGILMIALGTLNTLASAVISSHRYIDEANKRLDVINMVSKELLYNASNEELKPLQQQTIRLDTNNKDLSMAIVDGNIVDVLISNNTPDGDVEFIFIKEELWQFDVYIHNHNGKTFLCSFYKGGIS